MISRLIALAVLGASCAGNTPPTSGTAEPQAPASGEPRSIESPTPTAPDAASQVPSVSLPGSAATSSSPPTASATPDAGAPRPVKNDAEAFQRAFQCANQEHGGLGIWGSPLVFTGARPQRAERGWVFSFLEKEPKGKPQGLTLLIDKQGACKALPME